MFVKVSVCMTGPYREEDLDILFEEVKKQSRVQEPSSLMGLVQAAVNSLLSDPTSGISDHFSCKVQTGNKTGRLQVLIKLLRERHPDFDFDVHKRISMTEYDIIIFLNDLIVNLQDQRKLSRLWTRSLKEIIKDCHRLNLSRFSDKYLKVALEIPKYQLIQRVLNIVMRRLEKSPYSDLLDHLTSSGDWKQCKVYRQAN